MISRRIIVWTYDMFLANDWYVAKLDDKSGGPVADFLGLMATGYLVALVILFTTLVPTRFVSWIDGLLDSRFGVLAAVFGVFFIVRSCLAAIIRKSGGLGAMYERTEKMHLINNPKIWLIVLVGPWFLAMATVFAVGITQG